MRILLLFLILLINPASAHELWIEPLDYQPPANGRVAANIVNGQLFDGFRLAFIPRNIVSFKLYSGSREAAVESRIGDMPALDQAPLGDGLHVVAYQSTPTLLTYTEFEKFQSFVQHKDFAWALERHRERGLSQERVKEVYTRFSKSLIGVGGGAGNDRSLGLETEFVALDNPYTGDLAGEFRVRLTYRGEPRAGAQVELFEKAPGEKEGVVTFHRADENGVATLPVKPGLEYMIDAVVLREPDDRTVAENGAEWESLWANMTFAVPAVRP